MNYKIEIREILSRTLDINADSFDDAFNKVQELYDTGEIVLDYEDFQKVEYLIHDECFKY